MYICTSLAGEPRTCVYCLEKWRAGCAMSISSVTLAPVQVAASNSQLAVYKTRMKEEQRF